MLNILGMIILIIILFIIILLIIGIKISLEYNKTGSEFKGCLKILIFKRIKVYSTRFPSEDDEDEDEDREHKKRNIKKIYNLAKPCLEDLIDYIKALLKTLKITRLENHIIFGMASFADTGKYIGIIWAILATINPIDKNIAISAEPSFAGSRLDASGVNQIDFYPLKILVPTIRLLLKKDVRLLIRGVLDER